MHSARVMLQSSALHFIPSLNIGSVTAELLSLNAAALATSAERNNIVLELSTNPAIYAW